MAWSGSNKDFVLALKPASLASLACLLLASKCEHNAEKLASLQGNRFETFAFACYCCHCSCVLGHVKPRTASIKWKQRGTDKRKAFMGHEPLWPDYDLVSSVRVVWLPSSVPSRFPAWFLFIPVFDCSLRCFLHLFHCLVRFPLGTFGSILVCFAILLD